VVYEQHGGLARIQVAATLRRMREQAGVSREAAAAALYCTTSKIGDLETGRSRIKPAELEKLLELYGAAGVEREQLIATARDARSRRRRRSPESSIPLVDQRFFDLESQARKITFFSPELLPGFLQTDAYATALLEWRGTLDADELQRRVALRAVRRANLTRADGPACWCILGEAALRANVGGPATMASQLRALLEMGTTLNNLVIQVLPLGSGAHGSMGITRTLLIFDPPAQPVLHVDTNVRNVYYDGHAEVTEAADVLDLMKAISLDRHASRTVIEQLARQYEEAGSDGALGPVVHPT
jgi:transcriptional regulator with XRE-family HTH domain